MLSTADLGKLLPSYAVLCQAWRVSNAPNPEIAAIESRHPGWTIGRTESGLCWEAVSRPSQRSMHVVVSVSLAELAARLDAIETPEQGASRARLALRRSESAVGPGQAPRPSGALIVTYLSGVQHRWDRPATWHNRHPPSQVPSPSVRSRSPERPPGRAAAGRPGRRAAARLCGDRSAAPEHGRAAGPADRDDLPGTAPARGGRADRRVLVGRGRAAQACVPVDCDWERGVAGEAGRLA
jgi:hypothetical protein